MARAWYAYDGFGSLVLPSSYIYTPDRPVCRNGFSLCAVYAIYGGQFPTVISANLRKYIAAGLTIGTPQPQIPVNALAYIYLKDG
ncbi:hypothetical protein TH53_12580 [Pedobacter lusitanus]|uniref:Uncharacterized protein n=1 Tax=Pedobacter lusitanus TaxID=1503925 RepID=A0A0D0GHW9_9SPHI|nr:hypothetical protein [Pedobacter lusitanus]KIO76837.1 hypothetical protein TH53_12580 [Pedobacter lusitanus]